MKGANVVNLGEPHLRECTQRTMISYEFLNALRSQVCALPKNLYRHTMVSGQVVQVVGAMQHPHVKSDAPVQCCKIRVP
jgi:hypothetical protein